MWNTPDTIKKILKFSFMFVLSMIFVWILFKGIIISKNYEMNFTSPVIFLCFLIWMSLAGRPSFKLKEIKWDIIIVSMMYVLTFLLDTNYRRVQYLEYPLLFLYIAEGYLIARRFIKNSRSIFPVYEYALYKLNSLFSSFLSRLKKR